MTKGVCMLRTAKYLFTALVILEIFSGCFEGPVGPQGEKGEQGEQGLQGIGVEDSVFFIEPQPQSGWKYTELRDDDDNVIGTVVNIELRDYLNDSSAGKITILVYEGHGSNPNIIYNIELHNDWFESGCGYICMQSDFSADNWNVRKDMEIDIDNGVCFCKYYDTIWVESLREFELHIERGYFDFQDFLLKFYKIKPVNAPQSTISLRDDIFLMSAVNRLQNW